MQHARKDYQHIQEHISYSLCEKIGEWFIKHATPEQRMQFHNEIILPLKTKIPDQEPVFLLRAKDELALNTLEHYYRSAIDAGCTDPFTDLVNEQIIAFMVWKDEHPVKLPDLAANAV